MTRYVEVDERLEALLRSMFAARCRELGNVEVSVDAETYADRLEELIDFYYEELGEAVGGVLHPSMDDGDLANRLWIESDVRREVGRDDREGERDWAGIALGQAILQRDDARDIMRARWAERRAAASVRARSAPAS